MLYRYTAAAAWMSVLAFAVPTAANASIASPLDCALSGATSDSSCSSVSTDSGDMCVWCTSSGNGVCLTPSQAQTFEGFGFQCNDHNGSDDATPAPGKDDDDFMDGLLRCLLEGDDAKGCGTSNEGNCIWCTSHLYGVCITKDAAQTVDQYQYFDCAPPADIDIEIDAQIE